MAGHLAIALLVLSIGVPLYWMAIASLKSLAEIYTFPPLWLPTAPRLENFPAAWRSAPFDRFYLNSVVTTGLRTGRRTGRESASPTATR